MKIYQLLLIPSLLALVVALALGPQLAHSFDGPQVDISVEELVFGRKGDGLP